MPEEIKERFDQKDIQEGRFFAVISYISFLCVLSLILKKENKFAIHHAKNGLVLFVCEVVAFILSMIPFLGLIIRIFGSLLFILISLLGITRSLSGADARIPFISKIADNIVL